MRKLRKGLSKFLATALSVALIAQPAMTAFADELIPKAVTEMMESTVEIPGDVAAMSLLPLEERQAYLVLNGYEEEQLKAMPLEELLDKLVNSDGDPVEIPEDANVVWTFIKDENGDVIYDEYDLIERDAVVDVSRMYYRNYSMEMIVGSGKQLDPENIRYDVNVYLSEFINESIEYILYYSRPESTYRNRYNNDRIVARESGILEELDIPVSKVTYYVEDDMTGYNYYLGLESDIAKMGFRNEYQVDVYPMAEFVANFKNGEILDESSAITDEILNLSNMYDEGGYTGPFGDIDWENPLDADNFFCITYTDAATGKVVGYHGIIFVIKQGVLGNLYALEDDEMKNIVDYEYGYNYYGGDWSLNTGAEGNQLDIYYSEIDHYMNMLNGYAENADYYYVLDETDPIESIVLGNYYSKEDAEYNDAVDVTEEFLESNPRGYKHNFGEDGRLRFTVFYEDGGLAQYYVRAYGESDSSYETEYDLAPVVNQADPYFRVDGEASYDSYDDIFVLENEHNQTLDTIYGFGYQTLFINDTNADLSKLKPEFWTPDDVKAHVGTEQISGESVQDFSEGSVYYAVHIGDKLKNYNVTFAKKASGPKLFVNGPSKREIFLDEYFENRHDILVANLGDEKLKGLEVELIDAKNVAIDEYWNLGGEDNDTLEAFTTGYEYDMANLAKIRLRPQEATDSNATVKGKVEGKLKISADGQDPVYIELTGYAGNPEIITATMSNAVEYVPYSFVVGTDNMHDWNKVTFSIEDGELPEGLKLYPATGEIYGVPLETGEFPITVMAEYSREEFAPSYADFVLTVEDNTNENVYKASDKGYEIKEHVGTEMGEGTYDFFLEDFIEQTFTSNGEYDEFIDFWFNGEKLKAGKDYDKESGSTKITIRSQTFRTYAVNGANTIAAEFRVDGDKTKELKRTAQNFRMNVPERNDDNDDDGDRHTSSSSSKKKPAAAPVVDPNTVFTDQSWIRDDFGWWVKKADGSWLTSTWYLLPYMGTMEWYYFGADGYMKTGWFEDADGNKYYLHPISDGTMGRMYYGWKQIDGKWYYFNEVSDGTKGALKTNAWIGDYYVNENGVWVE